MAGYKFAFGLTKQEVRDAVPPGTVQLIDHHDILPNSSSTHDQNYDTLNLLPLPSSDPADPLNWASWRKTGVLINVSMFAFISNFQSASISSALPQLIPVFLPPKSLATLTHLIAVNVLMLGASNLWWVPLANTFGRRPIVLLSLLMLCLCSMWASLAHSFTSLLAARAFMGIGAGSAETLGPDIIGEIYFVHQRGRAIACYTLFLAIGSLIGGISGSYVAANLGWRWINWLNVILAGGNLLLCLFFLPETLFGRASALRKTFSAISAHPDDGMEKAGISTMERTNVSFKPYTFARSLRVGTYRPGLFKRMLDPYKTLVFPGVWMAMLQYAGLVGGVVTISTVGPQLVSMPPYLWNQNAGLINIGGIVGAVLGWLYAAITADRSLTSQAKHEAHGLGEPESRLLTQFPGLALAALGLFVFGGCAQHPAAGRWIGLEFGLGMLSFGLLQAPSISFTYVIDSYNAVSGDCLVMIVFFRGIISFAWTFFVAEWVQSAGPMEPFGIFGMLMGIFTLLTVPQYIWGKRTRIATAKWLPKHTDH